MNCFSKMARLHKIKLLLADREFNFIPERYLWRALMKYSVRGAKKMNSQVFCDGSENFDAISESDSSDIIESNESSNS